MGLFHSSILLAFTITAFSDLRATTQSLVSSSDQHSTSSVHVQKPSADSDIVVGTVVDGVYHNKSLGLSYKIPAAWVLRTDEMNVRERAEPASPDDKPSPQGTQKSTERNGGRVLLAAFSRPPEAHGQDVNASVVIAAESVEAYPGLKEPAQYFGPLTEVAAAQGLTVDEEPYEFEVGPKKLVRGDFHKDVGLRVMRQSTLVWLARGYAVSITVIGGTEDEVEGLVDAITFAGPAK